MEEWRNLGSMGLPAYSVSSEGRVRNDHTHRIMRLSQNQNETWKIGLIQNPSKPPKTFTVARLVAHAFLEDPPSREFDTPIHLDGNRSNLSAHNLAWRPRWFAQRYHIQFGAKPYIDRPIVLLDTDEVFTDSRHAAITYGVLERDIFMSCGMHEHVWPHSFDFRIYQE